MRIHAAGIGNDGGVIAAAATGTTVIEADGAIDNNGSIGANGQLTLKAQTLSSGASGGISAGTDLELAVTRALDNAGAISATGMLHVDQAHTAFANSGTITAGAGAYLNLDRINNRGGTLGTLQGANLDMHANSLDNRGGRLLAGGDALVNVKGDADNGGGVLQAASSLDAQVDGILHNAGGVIESLGARGTLALHAGALSNDTGRIVNAGSGATLLRAQSTLVNTGQIAGNGTLDLQAGTLVNTQDGKLASGAAMTITAGERFENVGTVNSGAPLDIAAHGATVANSGRIVANGALGIASAAFYNDGGQLATAAGSGADLVLDAAGISNRGGSILSNRNARLSSAGTVDNTGGTLQAAGSLRLDAAGAAGNDGGVIETLAPDATLSMHAGRLDNGNGRIVNVGTGATTVNVDGTLASRGTLAANGSLDLVVGALDNQAGGSIAAAQALHVGATQGIANAGAIDARGTLTLDAVGPVANRGSIAGGADVALHAGDLSNVDGTVSAGATLDVRAGAIDNTGGRLVNVGSGATRITADGSIVNGGVLAGNGSVDLTAAGVDNRAGGTIAAGAALDLHVTRQLDNAGTISAGTTLNMDQAATRIANSGAIVAAGELTLHGAAIANDGGRIATLAGAGMVLRSESTLSNRAGIIAATGDANLDAHGAFDNTQGRVQTQGQLGVRAVGALTNAGGVIEAVGAASALALQAGPIDNTAGRIVNAGNGRADISSTGAIVNSGTIGGNGALAISAQELHNTSEGVVSAGGTVDLALQGQLENAGTLRSGASLHADLAGGTFTNTGMTAAAGDVGIAAGSVDNSGGMVSADGLLQVAAAGGVANAGGTLHGGTGAALAAGGALANGSGTIETAAGTLDVAAQSIGSSGRIVNAGTGATSVASASSLVNDGTIAGNGALTLSAQTLQNTGSGNIGSGAGLELAVSRQMDNAGTVTSTGTLHFNQPAAGFTNRGNIGAGGAIDITATAMSNAGGRLYTANGSGAAINLRSNSLDNTGGMVSADGGLQADVAGATANNGGSLHGGSGITVHAGGALANGSGTIETVGGTLDVAAQSIDSAGRIVNVGTGATTVAAASSIANRGTIAGNGMLTLAAQTLQNAGSGAIGSGANMELAVRQQLDNAGSIGSGGSVHVDQAGARFANSGQIGATSGIDITAATIANAGGQLYTLNGFGAAIGLHATGGLDNAGGTISADGTLLVQVGGNVGNGSGFMHAGSGLTLDAGGALNNGSGTIENAAGTFTLDAASLANGGRIVNAGTGNTRVDVTSGIVNSGRIGAAGNIDVSANTIDNTGGTVAAGAQLAFAAAGTIANDAGTLQGAAGATVRAGGTLANGSGTIQALAGTLQVQAQAIGNGGSIVNGGTGATTISSTGAIVNSGTIGGNGTLDLHAAALQNGGGRILSGRALLLDMRQALTNTGTINSGSTLTFNQAGASFTNSGQIAAAGDIRITAAALDNNGGRISTVRGSGSDVTLAASSLSNRGGAIMADGDATLSIGGAVDNTHGLLQAGGNLILAAAANVGNDGGVIETLGGASSLSVTAAGIDNGSGRIVNAGSGATRLLSQSNIDNGGTIAGMGNVLLSGQSVSNATGATIASGNGLTLAVSRQFVNRGKVNSAGTLTFDQAGATFTNSGEMYAGGDVVIHAGTMNNDGGNLGTGSGSGASLALSSRQLSNLNGHIVTAADLVVNTGTFTGFGELFGGRDLALSMGGDFVQNGAQQIHANRNFSLSVTGSIVNGSTLAAAGTLALSGQNITNQAGASIEGRNVVLNAAGNLTNAGEINGQDTLNIRAAAVGNTGGIVGGNVALATGNLGNTGPAALVGATESLALGVAGTLNNTGGATLYSSGDMVIGGRDGGSAGAVNNVSSTIEAVGNLTLNTNSLSNVRENVQIVQVQTVDETRHMSMPSWYQYGDNHNAFETSAANYSPHEVYFVNPSDVLDDQVWVTPDGNTLHRAVIRTHANDSAFYVALSGLSGAYGKQTRLMSSEGTRVIYYTQADYVANPDQGGAASNAIVYADSVSHWSSTVSFSNQYGTCSSGCIRLITQPDYNDPGTTILRDTMRALAPVKSKLEFSRDAHHVAVEDQVAPGAGASAQILSGGNMHLTVGSTLENRYGDIKARGSLWIDGSAAINNVGATLYRTHTFDGTWTTYDGQTVAYQQPSISEVIGSAAGVIQGGQGVSISGRSFSNVDVTAGTVGNIRSAVHVIGSGVVGAGSAGVPVAAANVGAGPAGVQAAAGTGVSRFAATTVLSGESVGAVSGVHATAGHGNDGAASGAMAGSAMAAGPVPGGAFASTGDGRDPGAGTYATASGVTNGLHADGSAYAGGVANDGRLGSRIAAVRNTTRAGNVLTAATTAVSQQAGSVQGVGLGSVTKVSPGGLFLRNPDANGSYLFETRPQFANRQQWTSSDYLLKQLEVDPSSTQKRLGDGFYEQRLVREQLAELTGHALGTGASDDSTYKQLLTNAVSAAREFGLRPGVTLSAEQVSHLTSDIVWMESQTVMLPDGSTETVLVPKVYLAHLGSNAVTPGGALVTGNGVQIDTTESIANTGGVIDGGNGRTLLVAAQDIVNQGGTIKGGAVALAAGGDVRNESLTVKQSYDFGQNSGSYTSLSNTATISATGALDIMAGRDLSDLGGKIAAGSATLSAGRNIDFNTIQTGSTYQSNIAGYTEKDSSVTHQLSQISTGGDLKMAAMGNLSLTGTQVSIGTSGQGTGQLLAGGNVNIAAVVNEVNTSVQNDPGSKQYDKQVHANQTVVGTGVKAAGDLTVGAGIAGSGALNVTGSSLTAGGALALSAADGVNIVSTQEAHLSDTAITRSSSSVFKSKTTQQADYVASSQAIGSSVSGKTVDINAGKDVNVLGSAIAGDANVSLAAAGSVNIAASTSTLTESHHTQVKESGFLSGGGFGISYGTRTTTTDQQRDATTQSGQSRSVVGSLGGNLDIVAGNAVKVSGSDLAAGLNMTLDGRSVTIDPGQDNTKGKYEQKTVQDGLTFAVGGSVVNAIQTYQSMHSAASLSKDTRVQALAAATAAMAASSAAKDVAKNGPSISLSLTAGHSESQYTQTTSNLLNSGSVLNAGKDLLIRASGAGQDSNVNVIGSQLNAQGNVTLLADNQVNLLAAQNQESQHSDTRSMSAAAGISATVGAKGISAGLTASASVGRGNEDGNGTTQMNTHVAAGQDLAIHSGGDTNLKGAVASGTRVVADVGGNLAIESLQDTARFDSKNQSLSASGMVGVGASVGGGVNQSQVHNDYASVQEQSGLRAGDGGFQIAVGGNTNLKGGVVSSSTAGAATSSLTTGTLTYSDVENKAVSSGSSIGMSGGATIGGNADNAAGKEAGGVKLVNVGPTGAGASLPSAVATSNNQSGVTHSGIGAGTLAIKDEAAQLALTGQSAAQAAAGVDRSVVTGSDTSGRIDNKFDANATNATLAVNGAFTSAAAPIAAKMVGDIAQKKQTAANFEALAYADLAEKATDPNTAQAYRDKAAEAQATADAWGDNGVNRLALHGATQGLIGGLTNGSAGVLASGAGVAGGNLGQQLGARLGAAEAERRHLNAEDSQKLIESYQQTFAPLGGALAGIAATSASGNSGQYGFATTLAAGTTAATVDQYNRKLHDDEWKFLKRQQQGETPEKQQRLADAACALVHCSAGLPEGKAKDRLWEQEKRGEKYIIEQSVLKGPGQFDYSRLDKALDYISWLGEGTGNAIKDSGRDVINAVYTAVLHPGGAVQPSPSDLPDFPDDLNGPRPNGGTVAVSAMPVPVAIALCRGNPACEAAVGVGAATTPGKVGKLPLNVLLSDGRNENKVTGETQATATGKQVHADLAAERHASGDFDLVNQPFVDADGKLIEVAKRVDLATGTPASPSRTQIARPDAVKFDNGVILDDKPLGRPISKDRQEVIRFINAYQERQGALPKTIAIQRYDPITGLPVKTEIYTPYDFMPWLKK